jgi:hypothetical protein
MNHSISAALGPADNSSSAPDSNRIYLWNVDYRDQVRFLSLYYYSQLCTRVAADEWTEMEYDELNSSTVSLHTALLCSCSAV